MACRCRGPVLAAFVYPASATLVIAAQELRGGSTLPRRKRVPEESTELSFARNIKGG